MNYLKWQWSSSLQNQIVKICKRGSWEMVPYIYLPYLGMETTILWNENITKTIWFSYHTVSALPITVTIFCFYRWRTFSSTTERSYPDSAFPYCTALATSVTTYRPGWPAIHYTVAIQVTPAGRGFTHWRTRGSIAAAAGYHSSSSCFTSCKRVSKPTLC